MPSDNNQITPRDAPKGTPGGRAIRGGLNAAGGLVPFVGGLLSAAASAWSEHEQEKVNKFFEHWLKMLGDEMSEKAQTVVEIMARLDVQDDKIADRISSKEYQSLMKKAFREWSAAESEEKRKLIRNILANAAASEVVSDDVVRLFLEWLKNYSELHFTVIGAIYNSGGITRAGIWHKIGKQHVREDSAEADLFKLLIRDLSTGSIIRQHRETDYAGNFLAKRSARQPSSGARQPSSGGRQTTMKSAFDDEEPYELTQLGDQFVHYAMTDLPPKIGVDASVFSSDQSMDGARPAQATAGSDSTEPLP
jgi:hypothetical protein